MKHYILITTIFFFVISYSQSKHNNYQILDNLAYARLPEENYLPKGNDVFQKISANKDSIVSSLIEKVLDTTSTELRIADSYNYKVGDIAVLILPYTSSKKIPLRNILFEEYKYELRNTDKEYSLFDQIYYKLFFRGIHLITYLCKNN